MRTSTTTSHAKVLRQKSKLELHLLASADVAVFLHGTVNTSILTTAHETRATSQCGFGKTPTELFERRSPQRPKNCWNHNEH